MYILITSFESHSFLHLDHPNKIEDNNFVVKRMTDAVVYIH